MWFETRPAWKLDEYPATSSTPGSRAAFVPWKNGPTTCPWLSKVTGTWASASSPIAQYLLTTAGNPRRPSLPRTGPLLERPSQHSSHYTRRDPGGPVADEDEFVDADAATVDGRPA